MNKLRGFGLFSFSFSLLLTYAIFVSIACTHNRGELGSEGNPIKLFFVPSVDAKVIEDSSRVFKDYLEKNTPYKYQVGIPTSYVAVVEAFGTQRADIAALNTFGYILANEKYGIEARLTFLRYGSDTYQAQIIARKNGPIKKIEDINKKKMAFVDPASASGYLLPMKMFKDKNIVPSETVFANKHDNVVSMVYQGQVDAGATFYTPAEKGEIQDARRLVKQQYPDVESKVAIVQLTERIPNDPIAFRKELSNEMKTKITDAFLSFVKTDAGKQAFTKMYGVTDLKTSTDSDYESVRKMLKSLNKSAQDLLKK